MDEQPVVDTTLPSPSLSFHGRRGVPQGALVFYTVELFAVGQFAMEQIDVGTPKNIQGLDIFF